MLTTHKTSFADLLIIEPRVFTDDRGYFFESWNREVFARAGLPSDFVQDNQSASLKHVLRGLHFQVPPHDQGKLVRVITGSVLDVAVDLRRKEPTYGKHFSMILTAQEGKMLYIPPGFAHGFLTLEDHSIFAYKCTHAYHPRSDRSLRWNDPDMAIDWGVATPLLSDKDRNAPLLSDFDNPF